MFSSLCDFKSARTDKASQGKAGVEHTPLAIRTTGVTVLPELRSHVRARLGAKLSKFVDRIERVSVRFEDINGPRGGVDIVCRIKVVLGQLPDVVVAAQAESKSAAFESASASVVRAVRKTLDRGITNARKPPAKKR